MIKVVPEVREICVNILCYNTYINYNIVYIGHGSFHTICKHGLCIL